MKDSERWLPWLLLAAISVAVLLFGGTEPLSLSIVQGAILLTVVLVLVRGDAALSDFPLRLLAVPVILVFVVALQLMPIPAGWLSAGRAVPDGASYGAITFDLAETGLRMVNLLACICAFALALAASRRSRGFRVMVYGLAILGLFEAVYGLVQYLTGWQQIFTYVKIHNLHEATGTYINRNHYAGLLAMTLPFCLALAWYHLGSLGRRTSFRRAASDPQMFRGWLWFFLAGVVFVALIFSRSRMGILSVTVSSLAVIALILAGRQKTVALALSATLVLAGIGFAIWIGPGPVIERFELLGDEVSGPQTRPAIWNDALRLIAANPLLGTGLGTFPIAYTSVQTAFLGRFVNSAHNDYLEFASDIGVPAALLLFGACLWVLWAAMRRILAGGPDHFARSVSLGVVGALLAILLHSFVDFNLQIPANALVFSVILGLGCACGMRSAASISGSEGGSSRQELSPA